MTKKNYDAFISYCRDDQEYVRYIADFLEMDYDLQIWADYKAISPGDQPVHEIESGLETSSGAIVCMRKEPDRFQAMEMRLIVQRQAADPSFKVYPVYLPGFDPGPAPKRLIDTNHHVDLQGGLHDLVKLRQLANALRRNKLVPIYSRAAQQSAAHNDDLPDGYRADLEKITSLLIGNSLYSFKDVAIRELVQNAFDACLRRRHSGLQYPTEIVVRINDTEGWFEVCDTGEGMSPSHLLNQFAVIGKSISQEEEILGRTLDGDGEDRLDLIAKFGIGFISTFILADSILVSTRHEGYQQINFGISDVAEPFVYSQQSEVGRPLEMIGTTVRVNLRQIFRKDGKQPISILDSLTKYCRHVPFLTLEIDGRPADLGGDWNIPPDGPEEKPRVPVHERTIPRLYQSKLAFFESDKSGVIFSNQGFYIETNSEQILPKQTPAILAGEVNFFPGVADLNIARDKVIKGTLTEKLASEFKEDIRQLFRKEHEVLTLRSQSAATSEPFELDRLLSLLSGGRTRSAAVLAAAMNYFIRPSRDAILSATEAAEFILDGWHLRVPKAGLQSLREVLQYARTERNNRIYFQKSQQFSALSEAQKVFKDSAIAEGDVVVQCEIRTVHFADRSYSNVDEAAVLHELSRRFEFSLVDISSPTDEQLEKLSVQPSQVHSSLKEAADRVLQVHGAKVEFTKFREGPAAFAHSSVNYINLANPEMLKYMTNLADLDSEAVFVYLCGLVQRSPFPRS